MGLFCRVSLTCETIMDFFFWNYMKSFMTTPELAPPSPNFHTRKTGERLNPVKFILHRSPLHGWSSDVLVNGDRYRAMITNFFIPELNNHDVQELWFQQDGATCHTARTTINLLKDTFGDRLISRFGPVNWPPRYCDLTPLD
ncbi:hypothetical protein TNCV_3623521 [Trichonephila clavipes]|nr:hypothetical protein TNCV_3623521 [Trichonephila clavipes]